MADLLKKPDSILYSVLFSYFFKHFRHIVTPAVGGMLIAIAAMLFYAGIGLIMEDSLNSQTGLMVGVSITVGMIAETNGFFIDLIPAGLAPVFENGVAMGGFTAFALSILIHLAPRQKICFSIDVSVDALPLLIGAIRKNQKSLRMTAAEFHRMELSCEETFMHLISEQKGLGQTVMFKIVRMEDGLFTEAIIGRSVSDVVNLDSPKNLLAAKEEELSELGLFILGKIVKKIRHIQINGVSYISFIA